MSTVCVQHQKAFCSRTLSLIMLQFVRIGTYYLTTGTACADIKIQLNSLAVDKKLM